MRRGKVQDSRGRVNPTRQLTLQPVAVEGEHGSNEMLEALDVKGSKGGLE